MEKEDLGATLSLQTNNRQPYPHFGPFQHSTLSPSQKTKQKQNSWVKKGYDRKDGRVVALKFTNKMNKLWTETNCKQIQNEIGALRQLRHKHVIKLLAYNLNVKYPISKDQIHKYPYMAQTDNYAHAIPLSERHHRNGARAVSCLKFVPYPCQRERERERDI